MKTRHLLTFLFLFLVLFAFKNSSAQISKENLRKAAYSFIQQNGNSKKSTSILNIKELKDSEVLYAYVIELKPHGFIIFSTSEKLYPVTAYSFNNNFDFQASNENVLLDMLQNDLASQMNTLKSTLTNKQEKKAQENKNAWQNLINRTKRSANTEYDAEYGPLLPSVWGGVNCKDENGDYIYVGNYFTPNHYSPGCVATSLSQILNYFEWPVTGTGSHTDYDNSGSSQKDYYVNFAEQTYDWANMLDEYMNLPSTDTERRAMGKIAYNCGVALDMDYESHGSTSNVNKSPNALASYFRYTGHYEDGSWYYFWPRLRSNIENGSPVQLAVSSSNGAGHAIVCDGWRQNTGEDKYYHLNMGWWGSSNAWYRIQNSFNAAGYSIIDAGVFDIFPEPQMSTITRSSSEKTFDVSWNLSPNLNWEAFELQQSENGGTWTTISDSITSTTYTVSVSEGGEYSYRVRAKVNGSFYLNSYSDTISVSVKDDLVFLDFDGNDSYYVVDANNKLDVSSTWTFETWIKIDSHISGTYPVLMDRKTVFSCYLIDDADADYAVRFVARNSSGTIIASLRSDNSAVNLNYGEWVHVAASRTGGKARLFINGVQVDSSTDADFSLSSSTNALNLGARYWGSYSRYLDGKIDDIRISDIGRYTSTFTPIRKNNLESDSNTRLLMNLNEGAGTNIRDASGNFTSISLRSSPNTPNWGFEQLVLKGQLLSVKTEINKSNGLNMYPNPAHEFIQIELKVNENQSASLKYFSLEGRMISQKSIQLVKGQNNFIENISILPKGAYFMIITTDNKLYKKSILVN